MTMARVGQVGVGQVGAGSVARVALIGLGAAWVLWAVGVLAAEPAAAQGQAPAQDSGRVVSLPEAVELALAQNRDLRVARLEYEQADEQAQEAWGRTMPTLDASASYTRNLSISPFFLTDETTGEVTPIVFGGEHAWQLSIDGTQPLFDPAVIVGVGAAGRFKAYQGEVVRGTVHEVVTRARLAYYEVLLAEEAARLNRQSLARIEETLAETRAMHQAGLTSEYETLRLEVELSNVESDMRRAEDAVLAARRALAVELGLDPGTPIRTAGALASLELEPGANDESANRTVFVTAGVLEPEERPVEELIARARRSRSDLRQLELMEALRGAELRLERWSYLPRVSLFGSYTIGAQDMDFNFFGGSEGLRGYGRFAGVRLTMPLFAGFQRPARIAQREAVVDAVQVQQERAADAVESQIRTLHDQAVEARRRADAQRRAVEQAERGYRIASAEYREGLGSRLNVTDAEVALRRAEFNYAQSVYDYLAIRARIDEATGAVPEFE